MGILYIFIKILQIKSPPRPEYEAYDEDDAARIDFLLPYDSK